MCSGARRRPTSARWWWRPIREAIQAAVEEAGGRARDDPRRPCLGLRPHLRGAADRSIRTAASRSSSMCRAICRRSTRPISVRRVALLDDPAVDIAHLGRRDRAGRASATNPNVVKVVGSPVAPRPAARALFHPRHGTLGDGPLYHHIGLYAYRRAGAGALRRAAAVGARTAREARAVARARSRHADRCRHRRHACRSASIRPRTSNRARAMLASQTAPLSPRTERITRDDP